MKNIKQLEIGLQKLEEKTDRMLTKKHQRYLRTVVMYEARSYAARNLPEYDAATLEPYLTNFRGFYEGLKTDVSRLFMLRIQNMLGKVNIATIEQKIAGVDKKIWEADEQLQNLITDREHIFVDDTLSTYKKYKWILNGLCIGESAWTAVSFMKIGDVLAVAVLCGLIVGALQVVAVKSTVQLIKEIEDRKLRKIVFIAAGIFFGLVSFGFGAYRYHYAHQGAGATVPFYVNNPFWFSLINLMFVLAAGVIVGLFYPKVEDLKKQSEIDKLDKKIAEVEAVKQKLEAYKTQLINEREAITEFRKKVIHKEEDFLKKIDTYFTEAVGTFKNENTVKRPDHKFPLSFKNAFAPLSRPAGLEDFLLG